MTWSKNENYGSTLDFSAAAINSSTIFRVYRFMVFNATFNNIIVISWWSVLLVEEIAVTEENRHVPSHWQTLSHNVVSSTSHRAAFKIIQQSLVYKNVHT
jgi:hypothetical protein